MADTPARKVPWAVPAILVMIGVVASMVAPQIWMARHFPDIEPAPDPDFARDLGCQVVERCGLPHQSVTLLVGETVTVEPANSTPPGWLSCAERMVENYHGIGAVPISPCR